MPCVSEARLLANRANALKSTGPRTVEGKEASRANAYKHGLTGSGTVLPDVRVPTLVVHADDDPVVPGESVTPWLRDASPAVKVAWSARGGHVGWFGGLGEGAWVNTWAMDRVVEHLRAHGSTR